MIMNIHKFKNFIINSSNSSFTSKTFFVAHPPHLRSTTSCIMAITILAIFNHGVTELRFHEYYVIYSKKRSVINTPI